MAQQPQNAQGATICLGTPLTEWSFCSEVYIHSRVRAPWGRWRGGTRLRAARRCGQSRDDEHVNRSL